MNVPDGLVNYAPVRIFAPGKWRCTRDGLWAIVDSAGVFVVQCRYNEYGKPLITCTTEHPFYVHGKGWVAAQKLRVGDKIELQSGEDAYVDAVEYEKLAVPIQVYNFEVEEFHTYYVGSACVLVHNLCKQQIVAGDRNGYSARVSVGGEGNRHVPHAHIFFKNRKLASVNEAGKILAGELDKRGKRFVRDNLPAIARGIRKYYIGQ